MRYAYSFVVTFRQLAAVGLIILGLMIAVGAAFDFLDPVGMKAADDGDPFGKPSSRIESTLIVLGGVALIGLGAWAARRGASR